MKAYNFTLILDVHTIDQSIEDAILEAGCNDGFLSSEDDVVSLDFEREGASLQDAIQSAVQDVQSAGFQIVRIEPGTEE